MSDHGGYDRLRHMCLAYSNKPDDSDATCAECIDDLRKAGGLMSASSLLISFANYADQTNDLLRTATAFIEELKAFGYGETSEKALPGSFDPFVQAVEALKNHP